MREPVHMIEDSATHGRLGVAILLVSALALASCDRPKPVYVQRLYLEELHEGPDEVRVVVRFLDDHSNPVDPADPAALVPVVKGRPVGEVTGVSPVVEAGLALALVVPEEAGPGLFDLERAVYGQVLEHLGPGVEVAVVDRDEPAELLPVSRAKERLAGARPPAPPVSAAVRPSRHWVDMPFDRMTAALSTLAEAEGASRRVALVLLEGREVGSRWNAMARMAAAEDVQLHVVVAPLQGESPAKGRIEFPLVVYPMEHRGAVRDVVSAVVQGVAGGHVVTLDTDARGLDLVDGFGLRARLPRGGWEEFTMPTPGFPPATLSLEHLTPVEGEGFWMDALASDARGLPIELAPGDVRVFIDDLPAPRLATEPPAPEPFAVALMPAMPGSVDEAQAQVEAMAAAIEALPDGSVATLAPIGGQRFGEHRFTADLQGLLRQVRGLERPAVAPARDVETDIQSLVFHAGKEPSGHRRAILLLTGTAALRRLRGAGRGVYRLHAMLAMLHRKGWALYWVAMGPQERIGKLGRRIRNKTGGGLWTVASWAELPRVVSRVIRANSRPLRIGLATGLPLPELRERMEARMAYMGWLVTTSEASQ